MEKLTNINGLEVFKNNEKLRQRVWEDALENSAYYQANEILSYFRHYNKYTGKSYETLKDYEIDYNAAYIKANDKYLKEFFQDCITVAENFGIFDDFHNIQNKFNRIIEKLDLYEDATAGYYDMSDTNYNRLETWITNAVNETCEYIAEYTQEFYKQFDDENILEDYFLTIWLEYNNDLQVDENGHIY